MNLINLKGLFILLKSFLSAGFTLKFLFIINALLSANSILKSQMTFNRGSGDFKLESQFKFEMAFDSFFNNRFHIKITN